MKYLFALLLSLYGLVGFAQKKGDNLIVVQNQVFDSVVVKLLDHGYILTDLNEHFKLVTVLEDEHEFRLRVKDNGDLFIITVVKTANGYSVAKDPGGLLARTYSAPGKFAALFGTPEYRKIKIGL